MAMDRAFGVKTPTDLYQKLLFDIDRLRAGGSSAAVSYAAIDCAIDATHLADWVLRAVDNDHHIRLTGKSITKDNDISLKGFDAVSGERLPTLEYCRDIANHGKHFLLTRSKPMEGIETGRSIRIHPRYNALTGPTKGQSFFPYAYIKVNDEKIFVIELFQEAAEQWLQFLQEEGLWEEGPWQPDE
ncbi:hypothetical protein U8C31_18280 [Sinorhizobium medicae]|uniref:hypothetical protein n=1 Tax=Sinorhizobium medicae TaxID=110321 RepID=UPI002AF6AB91|nr:hypothetical protein [Sinorhizobium medicae]WQO72185.1 hypothetical protein U8C31_18280 [Sinorhizobium medicae]